jgi:hypothetical protein
MISDSYYGACGAARKIQWLNLLISKGIAMTKTIRIQLGALAVLLGVALMFFCGCSAPEKESADAQQQAKEALITEITTEADVSFSLYYGLVDKDSGKPEKTTAEYRQAVEDILKAEKIGYTAYEGYGAYPLEDGTMVENETLVFTGLHGSDEKMKEIVEKTRTELNLESVYCEANLTGHGIYGGVVNSAE